MEERNQRPKGQGLGTSVLLTFLWPVIWLAFGGRYWTFQGYTLEPFLSPFRKE